MKKNSKFMINMLVFFDFVSLESSGYLFHQIHLRNKPETQSQTQKLKFL